MNSEPQRETQVSIAINRARQAEGLLRELIDQIGSRLCPVLSNPCPVTAEEKPQHASSGTSKMCEDLDMLSYKLEEGIKAVSCLIDRLEV